MKKIMVATDFSMGSLNALHYTIGLSKVHNAELFIVHAYESPVFYTTDIPIGAIEDAERISKQNAEKSMQQFVASALPELSKVSYKTSIEEGLPGSVMAEISNSWHADLLVASATTASHVEQLIIGSTLTSIINKATCMVMVIPPKTSYEPYKRAVFATDMLAEHVKEVIQAEDLLVPMNTELDFLFIDKNVHSDSEDIDDQLSHLVNQQVWFGNRAAFVSADSDIEVGIQSFIKETHADLLIMVTERRNFPKMLFHRSVTKKMAYHPEVPLLILHSTKSKIAVS